MEIVIAKGNYGIGETIDITSTIIQRENENGNIYKRQSTSATTWGTWSLI
jgi:hypothetical protein